ncbi:hypothetical protein BH18ACT12_BH18ACT12_03540 [soil metagenome]
MREAEIAIMSPLVVLEEDELRFYCSRAFTLSLVARPSRPAQEGRRRNVE